MKPLSITRNLLLMIAAAITVWAMQHAAGFDGTGMSMIIFLLFGISPYLLFGIAAYALERFTKLRGIGVAGAVISAIMLAVTALAYLGTLGDQSSTYALIFVVMPIYLIVGSFVLLGLGILTGWLATRRSARQPGS